MKSKKVLATILSVVMLVASLPCIVLAGNETEEVEIPETQEITLDLTEGVATVVDEFGSGETKVFSFTPSSNGRYGFMCSNCVDLTASVTDQYGTSVVPSEVEYLSEATVYYLTLDAGKQYLFAVSQYDGSDSQDVQILIGRSSKTLHLGTSFVFAQTYSTKEVTFTPDESGVYVFNVIGQQTMMGNLCLNGRRVTENKDGYGNTAYMHAELTAGVTYTLELDLSYYSNTYYICNPMKVTITRNLPALKTGKNSVTVKANDKETFFQFIPTEDGVYNIYTKGDHCTELSIDNLLRENQHRGEGDNSSAGVCLYAGKTYFVGVKQSGSSEATIDVYIEKAPAIIESPTEFTVSQRASLYYSFTPSKSSFYRFYTDDDANVRTRLVKFGGDSFGNYGISYLKSGETYMIWVDNEYDENIDLARLYVEEIPNTLEEGSNTIDNSDLKNHVYALFTPKTSGKYTFNVQVEYAEFVLNTPTGEQPIQARQNTSSEGISDGCVLTAGETYLLDVSSWGSTSTVPVQITKDSLPVLGMGENPVSTQRYDDTYYSFTAPESGTYEFLYYLYPSSNAVSVQHGQDNGQGTVTLTWDSCHNTIVRLEKGKEYSVDVPATYDDPAETTLYIKKIAQLEEGTNPVDRPLAASSYVFHALFTPEETGLYSFTNGSSSFSSLRVNSFDIGEDFYKQQDSSYYYVGLEPLYHLEAGKTYLIEMSVRDTNTQTPVLVTKDPALKMGTNSVTIPAPSNPDDPYSYFSFTAPADGAYTFRFDNADLTDAFLRAGLYAEGSTRFETAGYYNGTRIVGSHLSKGETYRLRVQLDPNTNGEDLDIVIGAEFFHESKLEGYTLSLDGTIAANLYMTLADEVAESDTARLNVTFPNGTTKAYKMSDATPVTVNRKTYYVFHVPVAAKEMTSEIKAQLVGDDFIGTEYTFTVQDYAKFILEHPNNEPEFAAAVPLVKALLNYGAYSQLYFGYKTDALANSILDGDERELPAINPNSIPSYNKNLTSMPAGVEFTSVSLSLKTETELNLTFTNTTGKALSFTTDNRDVELKVMTSGDQTKLKITGIPAHKVNEAINLKVFLEGDSNTYYVSYSPIYYCRNQIVGKETETRPKSLKNLMVAFYLYNQAARNYIDN